MLYAVPDNIDDFIVSLEKSPKDLCTWFHDNLMKSNLGKYNLLVSSCEKMKMEIGDCKIENSTFEKFLGVHFDLV